ncbi:MAG: ComEC/Rec2 family competence protein, partial [Actinomycetota bacterium]
MNALRPFALSGALLIGIVAADAMQPSGGVALGAGVASVIALSGAWLVHRREPAPAQGEWLPRLAAGTAAMLVAGAFLGGFANMALRSAADRRVVAPSLDGRVVEITGRIVDDARRAGRAEAFTLNARQIDGRATRERISILTYEKAVGRLGDEVSMIARIRALDSSESFDRYLARRGVVAKGIAAGEIVLERRSGNPLLNASSFLRERMRQIASSLDREDGGVVLGLTIGDDELMSDETREDFRESGLSHLTAVSGTNVAIVLGAVMILLRAARVGRRTQILVGLAALVFFAVVTRWEPSVLRASIMASLALVAFFFGRGHNSLHGLGLAFGALLAFDPNLAWSAGFQLSFAATLGILVLAPRIRDRMSRLPKPLGEALAVALAAQAAVTPVLAIRFGSVSLVAVPANLVAFPLVAPITILGFAGALLGVLWPGGASLLFSVAAIFARALRAVASTSASIPGSGVDLPAAGLAGIVVACLVILAVAVLLAGYRRAGVRTFAVAATIWLLSSAVGHGAPPPREGLRLTFFDVGQGDAALAETPAGARVLIDGGPDEDFLAGVLARRGVRRIDLLLVSHFHFDHVNGLPSVLRGLQTVESAGPGVTNASLGTLGRLRTEPAGEGDRYEIGDLTVDVLGPPPSLREAAMDEASNEDSEDAALNDASLVIALRWGGGCALFTGDLEETG